MNLDYEDIKEYLLGSLSAAEREEIDLRIIEDTEFAIDTSAAEDHLIERYLDGELTDDESRLFRSDYLVTEQRARRVKEFAALRTLASRRAIEPPEAVSAQAGGNWFGLSGLFARYRLVTAMAVILVAALAGVGGWIYFADRGPTALEREYAALNQADMSDLARFDSDSKVELFPSNFRSSDRALRIKAGGLTRSILFRLPLIFDPYAGSRYRAELRREGKTVFSVPNVSPVKDGSGTEVRVLIPREIIGKGEYQIILSQLGTEVAPVAFGFVAD